MAYETGTVTGYDQLLTRLVSFLTTNADLVALNQNWVVEKEETMPWYSMSNGLSNTAYTGNFRDVYLRGPGLAQTDRIYVNIRQYQNSVNALYAWFITGATDFESGLAYEFQPGLSRNAATIPVYTIANVGMTYHFVANGRRFIIVAIIGGETHICHCGFILPYARPSEYPYPLAILGNARSLNINIESDRVKNFYNTDNSSQLIRLPAGSWNVVNNARPVINGSATTVGLWPSAIFSIIFVIQPTSNIDGSFTLLPQIMYTSGILGEGLIGEIEGVYYVPGTNVSSGADLTVSDTITIDGVTYLVVQNGKNNEQNDYAVIRLT